ncbi:MAG: hypothetical protein FWD93_04490 [Coriobacteriia bacterium]|nr:hypothetical protein [Coriobacteriia bacterium]
MSFKKIVLIATTLLMSFALTASLAGCVKEGDEVGNILDQTMWNLGGFPSQQEIRDHLQQKYGEEFTLLSLNSGARFFQGIAYPTANPDMVFNLKLIDAEGDPVAPKDIRDDYQARLAEEYIVQLIRPILDRTFGLVEVANLRVEVGLFDGYEGAALPASFNWKPGDGLAALAAQDGIATPLTVYVMLESAAVLDTMTDEDLSTLCEEFVTAGVALSGELNLRVADAPEVEPRTHAWTISAK